MNSPKTSELCIPSLHFPELMHIMEAKKKYNQSLGANNKNSDKWEFGNMKSDEENLHANT